MPLILNSLIPLTDLSLYYCESLPFNSVTLTGLVSSTYTDLLEERQAAVSAILTAGHIPAGMELFAAGDESQMDVIKQWIDESDVYLLILGGRYGSVESKSGKSYTQLEYEYAISKEKPLFACVVNQEAQEERVKKCGTSVIETKNPQKLQEFRDFVLTKTVRFWDDSKDIKIAIGETLAQFSRREDLVGWVRPREEANIPALTDEITRLSKENASLRSQLQTSNSNKVTINGLSFEELLLLLQKKGLVDVLQKNRYDFLSGISVYNKKLNGSQIVELSIFGLLEPSEKDFTLYTLTEAGKTFLNRLALHSLSQS